MADTPGVPVAEVAVESRPAVPASRTPVHLRAAGGARAVARQPECRPLAALSLVSMLGTAMTPLLIHHPLLLALLSPRVVFLALAAPTVPVVPFVVLLTARLSVGDLFFWRLGRRAGPDLLARWPRLDRLNRRSRRSQRVLATTAVAVRPIGRHVAWAGATGVSGRLVLAVDLASTVAYCVAMHAGAGLVHWP